MIDLDSRTTSTPHLITFGGKQGNVYLLDRARLPGDLARRPPCSIDAGGDKSLLAPEAQQQFGARGPLNVFGPYSEHSGMLDQARSRSTPAIFRDDQNRSYVFVTGSTKAGEDSAVSVPPGLARLMIVTTPNQPAYLRIDQLELTQTFLNPGSPVVSSDGSKNAIVWVLDSNAPRTTPLHGPSAPRPVLYAFDALSLKLLWKSAPGLLTSSGKYNEPTITRGTVFVGTDRIEAFGIRKNAAEDPDFRSRQDATHPLSFADGAREVDAASLFASRCASCHESGQPGIPPRAHLATLSVERIVSALTEGRMRDMATGLSAAQIDAIAVYLSREQGGSNR